MVDLNSVFLYHNDLTKGPYYFYLIATYSLQYIIIYNHTVETHKVNCFYCKEHFIHLQSNVLPTWAMFLNNVTTQVKINRYLQLYYETAMDIKYNHTNFICQWFMLSSWQHTLCSHHPLFSIFPKNKWNAAYLKKSNTIKKSSGSYNKYS